MTAAVQAVLEQAKQLSPDERAELRAELDALDESREWAAAWNAELDRRWAGYEAQPSSESADDVLAELRNGLRSSRP